MNFDVKEKFILSEDVRDIEKKLCKFYLKVIKDYFELDENFDWQGSKTEIRGKQTNNESEFHLFNNPKDLLLSCIEDTCLAIRKFYSSLDEYVEIAKYLSKKSLVTIYCVIGESLFAAIGICIVIDEAVEQYRFSHKINTKKIQIIVTDKRQIWRRLCCYIIRKINSWFKYVEIKLNFINERSDSLSVEVFRTLKEVDIVVMARYLSLFRYLIVRTHFLEVILKRMKELSILFYMDANDEIYYNTLKHLISKTDDLVEIMNKEAVYELLDDFEYTEHHSEFKFLRNTAFKPVIFSTCIKCSRIKDNTSVNIDIKDYGSSSSESEGKIKQQILERVKKENSAIPHLAASKVKYLRLSSKSFLNAPVQTAVPKTSEAKNIDKSSKMTTDTNICPLTSQITNFSPKNGTKFLNGHFLFPSVATVQSGQKVTPNTHIFRENKAFEKLHNTYKYLEDKKPQQHETVKSSKAVDKSVSKDPLNKHKYAREGKKPNTENVETNKTANKFVSQNPENKYKNFNGGKKPNTENIETNKTVDKFVSKNLQNKHINFGEVKKPNSENVGTNKAIDKMAVRNPQNKGKCSRKRKKSNAKGVNLSKMPGQSVIINSENKNKQSKINKQNTETVKPTKIVEKSANADLKIKHPGINKANAEKTKRNKIVGMLVTLNLRCKYTYSEKEATSSSVDNLEIDKNSQKLASTKLENGYKSPHLISDESLKSYASHLSDIYYSKHFDKGKPRTLKFK